MEFVSQCETGSATAPISKIASDPNRFHAVFEGSAYDPSQIFTSYNCGIGPVMHAANFGIRIESVREAQSFDSADKGVGLIAPALHVGRLPLSKEMKSESRISPRGNPLQVQFVVVLAWGRVASSKLADQEGR
jgi:hypothetical protein